MDDSDVVFHRGSPAKILQIDRNITHRQAVLNVVGSLTNRYSFKVGCMYQSATPAFTIDLSTLDISVTDLARGYVFARVLVDKGQEYSLRGEVIPPSRIVFTPLTSSQQKKLSDLFLQLSEGGMLYISVLQGPTRDPRVFSIPLDGFFEFSKVVIEDCKSLNAVAQDHRGQVKLLPDYVSREPADAAPKDYTLKPKKGSDGLDEVPPKVEEPPKPEVNEPEEEAPSILPFTQGGGVASIGDDGKPITADEASEQAKEDNLGQAKSMKIGDDGKPVSE